MYCKTCGAEMNDNQAICLKCGCAKGTGTQYCANCGAELTPGAFACMSCGVAADYGAAAPAPAPGQNAAPTDSKYKWCPAGKDGLTAILLAFFLGGLGIHNFYLGETKRGVIKLVLTLIGIGAPISGILALIDFIKMLTGSYSVDLG